MSLLSVIRRFFAGERPNPFGSLRVHYEGGDGSTRQSAIIVRGATSDIEGVAATFLWMQEHIGAKDEEWRLISHTSGSDGVRKIDTFHVMLRRGGMRQVYFDVSESFGKQPSRDLER